MIGFSGADGRKLSGCALIALLGIAGIPAVATGGRAGSSRTLDAKLRHGPGISNHPVGVVPSSAVRIPVAWPLGADGTLTCRTCHTKLPSFDGSTRTYLRGDDTDRIDSTDFCFNCHDADQSLGMHVMVTRLAHIPVSADAPGNGMQSRFDGETVRCLSCHDGVTARDPHSSTPWNRTGSFAGDQRGSHPVGVVYASGVKHKSSAFLRPIGLLPEKIRLPQGKVGCVSCHDLYGRDRHRLAVPVEGSALCFACHSMD